METLDWGQVTPEAANTDRNEFVYIYNHDVSSPQNIDRTIRFIIGRLKYYDAQLPKHCKHLIKIDVRGQQINDTACAQIKNEIRTKYSKLNNITIDIIK